MKHISEFADMSINRPSDLLYEPDYWDHLAEEKRSQAEKFRDQPIFAAVLERHAQDYERLAKKALNLRQTRARSARFRTTRDSATVTSISPSIGPERKTN